MPYIYGGAGKGERELCIGKGTVYVCMGVCFLCVCVCVTALVISWICIHGCNNTPQKNGYDFFNLFIYYFFP